MTLACAKCGRTLDSVVRECPECSDTVAEVRTAGVGVTSHGRSQSDGFDFRPGESFAGRYTIIERVGSGGMGVVYKAIDTALDTVVALKLIRPELAAIPAFADRFRSEVRITRRITHPNVCRVHDIGESEGTLFLSMEWIDGETLDGLTRLSGRMSQTRAVEVGASIAGALEAAHRLDVIHRDLKPANVMIDARREVRVLDFGLALETGNVPLGEASRRVGTPAYMSPEQRSGRPVDARSDLFSLGLILREMLVGQRLSPDAGVPGELVRRTEPRLAGVLQRLLRTDPAERPSTAEEVAGELRTLAGSTHSGSIAVRRRRGARRALGWIGGAALVVAVIAALLSGYRLFSDHATDGSTGPYYKRGMYWLTEKADSVDNLKQAVAAFRREIDDHPGSALAHARLAETCWLLFRRTGLGTWVEESQRRLDRAREIDPDLPEVLYVEAMWDLEDRRLDQARDRLDRAIRSRPEFVLAWARLGEVYLRLDDYDDALAAFEQARSIDASNYQVWLLQGWAHQTRGEYSEAERCYRRAVDLKSDSVMAWSNLGALLLHDERPLEAIEALVRAVEEDPEYATAHSNLGTAYWETGRFEEAATHYRRACELEPRRATYWGNLGDALDALGRDADAQEAYGHAAEAAREMSDARPNEAGTAAMLALYCAKAADTACAIPAGDRALRLSPDDPSILVDVAASRVVLGRLTEALEMLDRAVGYGASRTQIELTVEFAPLGEDPRYLDLLERAS